MKYTYLLLLLSLLACGTNQSMIERANALGKRIQGYVLNQSTDSLATLIDYNTFLYRIAQDKDLSKSEYRQILLETEYENVITQKLFAIAQVYDHFTFIRSYQEKHRIYSLFQFRKKDLANYLIVEYSHIQEELKLVDSYLFSEGLWFSEGLTYLDYIKDKKAKADQFDKGYALYAIKEAISKKEFDQAQELFNTVPAKHQNEKPFQLVELSLFSHLSEDKYQKDYQAFINEYPEDKNYALYFSYLRYLKAKNCKQLEKTIRELEKSVGKDSSHAQLLKRCLEEQSH